MSPPWRVPEDQENQVAMALAAEQGCAVATATSCRQGGEEGEVCAPGLTH